MAQGRAQRPQKYASLEHRTLCVLAVSAQTVITSDQAVRAGKLIDLKTTVDAAVAKCPTVKRVFVSKRTGVKVAQRPLDLDLDEVALQ